ncbi:4-azaleucine resistance probable transporter AzlC [Amphibacillus marinus]|uniref:4-azaleucine resistance probable transporter AzlC n=1 Tax=Amphibacillus marinus TaxID=872970 RepID=A0A1H8Q231_9BACI|nr:AzlC family ABC transporter permease [Amphibacillus marinus]SEO48136.1 4-azaleucine resistance probable transporter AzlC [Amphibacillus marinus]
MQETSQFKQGLVAGVPIMLGYLPIAITYGVLAKQAGLTLLELTSMSVLVYAGAAQFMGTNMLVLGAGVVEIVLATFVLNFRHFVLSLSFMYQSRSFPHRWRALLALGLTDETFSVASLKTKQTKEVKGYYFYGALFLQAYLSWVIGSIIGGIVGNVMPTSISQSLGIALYAMFIALLVPSVTKNLKYGAVAILAMVLNYTFGHILQDGWAIVLSTIIASFFGSFLVRRQS